MGTKKINCILVSVSILLGIAFIGCLIFSICNPEFNFVDTISAVSSFFVAALTIIYVYTASKQMELMKKQLNQMQQEQRLSEQPILDLESIEFKIERPRFFYTPPKDEYSYLSRYFFTARINNISNYSAVFVDVSAQLFIQEDKTKICLGATSRRLNVIPANSVSKEIGIMFTGDSRHQLMSILRSYAGSKFPELELKIYYKSLSGASYLLVHTYYIDVERENKETFDILKNWHTALVSAPIEEKEILDGLKKAQDEDTRQMIFDLSKQSFDERLSGDQDLSLCVVENPQKFSLKVISDEEFEKEIQSHQYGRYIGSRTSVCKRKMSTARENVATR